MKKIFIAFALAAVLVSCGSAPSGEGGDVAASIADTETAAEESMQAESTQGDVALSDADIEEEGGGEVASIDETSSTDDITTADGIASSTDEVLSSLEGNINAEDGEMDEIAAGDDDITEGDNGEGDVLSFEEVPEVEFDEDGRGVVVLPETKDWDAPVTDDGGTSGRVAQQPEVSAEEEELLETRYDNSFKEPDVALAPPPKLQIKDSTGDASKAEDSKAENAADSKAASPASSRVETAKKDTTGTPPSVLVATDKKDKPMVRYAADGGYSPTNEETGDAEQGAERQGTANSDGEEDTSYRAPTPVIASTEKRDGEKSLDLPILPKPSPSTQPSQVFVTEYNPADDAKEAEEAEEIAGDETKPSRTITIKNNQYLDVTYPGAGWVYLGEGTNEGKKIVFKGRKLGETQTQFTLRSQRVGTALLHFYKNDVLNNNYIDDYLEVVVTDEVASSTDPHVTAPDYAEIVPPRPKRRVAAKAKEDAAKDSALAQADKAVETNTKDTKTEEAKVKATAKADGKKVKEEAKTEARKTPAAPSAPPQSSKGTSDGKTVVQDVASKSPPQETQKESPLASPFEGSAEGKTPSASKASLVNPEESADGLLLAAQKAYNAKRYADCLTLLSAFFDKAASRIDEALYLEGLSLEARSPAQNIKGAIDTYDILMKNWPASKLWNKARERSIYLKRMYIDIR